MKNMIHIAYTVDDKYASLCQISMYSIIAHKSQDTEIYFYILALKDFLTDKTIFDAFNKLDDVYVQIIELDQDVTDRIKHIAKIQTEYDNFYPRLLIPDLPVFGDIDQVIHLDADTLILKDLTDLYRTDLKDNLVGMVFNQLHLLHGDACKRNFGHLDMLFNGGILLLNCKKIREGGYVETWFKLFEEYEGQSLYDETLFSHYLYDQTYQLPPTANIMYTLVADDYPYVNDVFYWNMLYNTNYHSITEILEQAYVLHMYGSKENLDTLPSLSYAYMKLRARLDKFISTGNFDANVKDIDNKLIYVI